MSRPYVVYVEFFGDGKIDGKFATLDEAIARARSIAPLPRGHHLVIYNDDSADGGYGDDGMRWDDGLTDDERERVDVEVHEL